MDKTLQHINSENLTGYRKELVEKAKSAALKAYAPYSNFKIGAAVLMSDGQIYTASNQENAAFGECICAERVTLLYATANNPDVAPKAMAIAAINNGSFTEQIITPCGACRQVFAEMEKRYKSPIELILYSTNESVLVNSAADLLPLSFSYGIMEQ
ncbi:MAG: cytidine deaminase [Bacteroidia bacterium]|nr:cytidine deaminase [Bacteroidia bacterium]